MHRPMFCGFAGVLALVLAAVPAAPTGAQRLAPVAATGALRISTAPPVGASTAGGGTGRTLFGATAGAVLGGLAGGVIGAAIGGRAEACQVGDPDGCLGAQLPRALWGTGVGITLGAPIGAHLGNRRGGNPAYTMLASLALFAGEIVALRALIDDGRTEHKSTVFGIAVAVPVLQIIATTVVERAFTSGAP